MLHRSGPVLVSAGALLLIFAVASGQTTTFPPRPSSGPVPTHSTVSCSDLAEYSQIHNNCDVYSNCSGTQCHLTPLLTGSTAKLWVEENCADPIMVDLNVDGPSNSFLNGYRHRFSVGGDGLSFHDPNTTLTASYGRNASHLTFQAMTIVDGDMAQSLIPEIKIPLNPRQCMCDSMRQIASILQSSRVPLLNLGLRCSVRLDCVGLVCNVTFGTARSYVADISIDPCGETVHMVVMDSNNVSQVDRMFNDSGSFPFDITQGLSGSFSIGMVHHNYSMDISVTLQASIIPIPDNILPSQKIILDRSQCINPTYYYEHTTSAPPTITTGGIPPAMTNTPPPPPSNCLQTDARNCQVTGGSSCSGIQCNVSSTAPVVVASAEVKERCADPVMVNMTVSPRYQNMFSVPGDGLGSKVEVNGDSVRVEYGRNASHLHFQAIGSTTTFIPAILIPLYPHNCMCQSMTNVANSIHVDTLTTVFGGATSCSRRPNCDGVTCVAVGSYISDVIIDPCQESVRILLRNASSGSVTFDQSFPQSAEYPLPLRPSGFNLKLKVGIVPHNFSMKLSMEAIVGEGTPPIVLLSPQRIILDRTNCVDPPYYHNPEDTTQRPASPSSGNHGGGGPGGSASPPTGSEKHKAPLGLVVGVPFGILAVLVTALVVAIATVLILWQLRKRKRAYAFQRMTFSEVDDDDEKD